MKMPIPDTNEEIIAMCESRNNSWSFGKENGVFVFRFNLEYTINGKVYKNTYEKKNIFSSLLDKDGDAVPYYWQGLVERKPAIIMRHFSETNPEQFKEYMEQEFDDFFGYYSKLAMDIRVKEYKTN